MALYIITAASLLLLFGFMTFCIVRFGLKDCFSRYSYEWDISPRALNLWSADLILSALLLMPVMLELSGGNNWQFTGFLAPIAMLLVGFTPRWATMDRQYIFHNLGVGLAVAFSVIWCIAIPKLVWPMLILAVLAGAATLICKRAFIFWLEIAMYLAIYVVLFCAI